MFGVGVQVLGVREGGGSPDGELDRSEGVTVVATDVDAGSGVAGEVSGRLANDLLPEVV